MKKNKTHNYQSPCDRNYTVIDFRTSYGTKHPVAY